MTEKYSMQQAADMLNDGLAVAEDLLAKQLNVHGEVELDEAHVLGLGRMSAQRWHLYVRKKDAEVNDTDSRKPLMGVALALRVKAAYKLEELRAELARLTVSYTAEVDAAVLVVRDFIRAQPQDPELPLRSLEPLA